MVSSTRAGANPLVVNTDATNTRITLSGERSTFLNWSRGGEITLVLPPDLARKLTVSTQQDTGVVLAQADIDQLIARTDNGEVVLSGSARRIEIHTDNGDIKVDFSDAAPRTVDVTSDNGDVIIALPARGPYVVNANSDHGDRAVRVPQATARENAVAVVTAGRTMAT